MTRRQDLHELMKEACARIGLPEFYADAMTAQAMLESGTELSSKLATNYNNFWGMKCGRYWQGASVNMKTMEESTDGTTKDISADFRAYGCMVDGVNGYFDFLTTYRYKGWSECNSAKEFYAFLKKCGWATDSEYVDKCLSVYETYFGSNAGTQSEYMEICPGDTVVLLSNMVVRTDHSTTARAKSHRELTPDGRKHDIDKNGCLDAGTRCTVIRTWSDGCSMWIEIPSGWVCAKLEGSVYARKV